MMEVDEPFTGLCKLVSQSVNTHNWTGMHCMIIGFALLPPSSFFHSVEIFFHSREKWKYLKAGIFGATSI